MLRAYSMLLCILLSSVGRHQGETIMTEVQYLRTIHRYDQEHDRSFFTFRDPLDSVPPSRTDAQQLPASGKRRVHPSVACRQAVP